MSASVSVIITEGKQVHEALRSVMAQTWLSWEALLVGRSLCHRLADVQDQRCRFVEPNGDRRNAGGQAAAGFALMSLRAGDELRPDALRLLLRALANGADLAYSDYSLTSGFGDCRVTLPNFSARALDEERIPAVSYMVRRDLWLRLGGWRPGPEADDDFLARAHRSGARIVRVPEVLYCQRATASRLARWEEPRGGGR